MKIATPLVAGLAAAALLTGAAMSQTARQPDPMTAADERAVIEVIDAVGFYADRDEWDRVAEQFHPDGVTIDYRSYATASAGTQAEPEPQSPQSVVEAWQTVLPGYDYTQHIIADHQVDVAGDEATSRANVHATHVLDGNHWVFLGDYEHRLVRTDGGWKIDRMTANLRAELGDSDLPQRATERVTNGQGRLAAAQN